MLSETLSQRLMVCAAPVICLGCVEVVRCCWNPCPDEFFLCPPHVWRREITAAATAPLAKYTPAGEGHWRSLSSQDCFACILLRVFSHGNGSQNHSDLFIAPRSTSVSQADRPAVVGVTFYQNRARSMTMLDLHTIELFTALKIDSYIHGEWR